MLACMRACVFVCVCVFVNDRDTDVPLALTAQPLGNISLQQALQEIFELRSERVWQLHILGKGEGEGEGRAGEEREEGKRGAGRVGEEEDGERAV